MAYRPGRGNGLGSSGFPGPLNSLSPALFAPPRRVGQDAQDAGSRPRQHGNTISTRGFRGMGAGGDPAAAATQAIALAGQIKQGVAQLSTAVRNAMTQYPATDPSPIRALPAQAQQSATGIDGILSDSSGGNSVQGIQSWYTAHPGPGPYAARDAGIVDAALSKLQGIASQVQDAQNSVSSWVSQAQGAAAAQARADAAAADAARQTQAASSQAQADANAVNQALTNAQAASQGGDFGTALQILQRPDVNAAATRIGRAGDISGAITAVNFAKKQADLAATSAAASAQAASCQAQGGTWTGSACDMTRANALAAAQRACADQGGQWNAISGSCDLSQKKAEEASNRVTDAINKAQALAPTNARGALLVLASVSRDAQTSGRQADVALVQADIQGQAAEAACAARGGSWDGQSCDMSAKLAADAQARQDAADAAAQARADALATKAENACNVRGGLWDGQTCDMSQVQQQTSLVQQFLPAILTPTAAPPPAQGGGGGAYLTNGPSQQQLEALALLKALGGEQGASIADALGEVFAQQTTPVGPAPATGAPDGTPCISPGQNPGVYQGGVCSDMVATPSGVLYGRPQPGETF